MLDIKTKSLMILSAFLVYVVVFILPQIFSGKIILPQLFQVGVIYIHYYGMFMAVAVGVGYWLAMRRAAKYDLRLEDTDKVLIWVIIGGFIGARLYHVASDVSFYWQHLNLILQVWKGGLSIFGALIGGLFGLLIYQYQKNKRTKAVDGIKLNTKYLILDTINYLNWLTPSIIIGQIIGRLGNLFNYEAYGYPTNLPWKMFVPLVFRMPAYQNIAYYHPLFLYEMLVNACIFIWIWRIRNTCSPLFFRYLLLYNIARFFLEFLRMDSTFYGQLRLNVITSGLLATIAFVFLYSHNASKKS